MERKSKRNGRFIRYFWTGVLIVLLCLLSVPDEVCGSHLSRGSRGRSRQRTSAQTAARRSSVGLSTSRSRPRSLTSSRVGSRTNSVSRTRQSIDLGGTRTENTNRSNRGSSTRQSASDRSRGRIGSSVRTRNRAPSSSVSTSRNRVPSSPSGRGVPSRSRLSSRRVSDRISSRGRIGRGNVPSDRVRPMTNEKADTTLNRRSNSKALPSAINSFIDNLKQRIPNIGLGFGANFESGNSVSSSDSRKESNNDANGNMQRSSSRNTAMDFLGPLTAFLSKSRSRSRTSPPPTQPLPTRPLPTRPLPTQPLPTRPLPTQPLPTRPMRRQLSPTRRPATRRRFQATNPPPTRPLPTQPLPTKPFPTQPLPPTQVMPTQPLPPRSLQARPLQSRIRTANTPVSGMQQIQKESVPLIQNNAQFLQSGMFSRSQMLPFNSAFGQSNTLQTFNQQNAAVSGLVQPQVQQVGQRVISNGAAPSQNGMIQVPSGIMPFQNGIMQTQNSMIQPIPNAAISSPIQPSPLVQPPLVHPTVASAMKPQLAPQIFRNNNQVQWVQPQSQANNQMTFQQPNQHLGGIMQQFGMQQSVPVQTQFSNTNSLLPNPLGIIAGQQLNAQPVPPGPMVIGNQNAVQQPFMQMSGIPTNGQSFQMQGQVASHLLHQQPGFIPNQQLPLQQTLMTSLRGSEVIDTHPGLVQLNTGLQNTLGTLTNQNMIATQLAAQTQSSAGAGGIIINQVSTPTTLVNSQVPKPFASANSTNVIEINPNSQGLKLVPDGKGGIKVINMSATANPLNTGQKNVNDGRLVGANGLPSRTVTISPIYNTTMLGMDVQNSTDIPEELEINGTSYDSPHDMNGKIHPLQMANKRVNHAGNTHAAGKSVLDPVIPANGMIPTHLLGRDRVNTTDIPEEIEINGTSLDSPHDRNGGAMSQPTATPDFPIQSNVITFNEEGEIGSANGGGININFHLEPTPIPTLFDAPKDSNSEFLTGYPSHRVQESRLNFDIAGNSNIDAQESGMNLDQIGNSNSNAHESGLNFDIMGNSNINTQESGLNFDVFGHSNAQEPALNIDFTKNFNDYAQEAKVTADVTEISNNNGQESGMNFNLGFGMSDMNAIDLSRQNMNERHSNSELSNLANFISRNPMAFSENAIFPQNGFDTLNMVDNNNNQNNNNLNDIFETMLNLPSAGSLNFGINPKSPIAMETVSLLSAQSETNPVYMSKSNVDSIRFGSVMPGIGFKLKEPIQGKTLSGFQPSGQRTRNNMVSPRNATDWNTNHLNTSGNLKSRSSPNTAVMSEMINSINKAVQSKVMHQVEKVVTLQMLNTIDSILTAKIDSLLNVTNGTNAPRNMQSPPPPTTTTRKPPSNLQTTESWSYGPDETTVPTKTTEIRKYEFKLHEEFKQKDTSVKHSRMNMLPGRKFKHQNEKTTIKSSVQNFKDRITPSPMYNLSSRKFKYPATEITSNQNLHVSRDLGARSSEVVPKSLRKFQTLRAEFKKSSGIVQKYRKKVEVPPSEYLNSFGMWQYPKVDTTTSSSNNIQNYKDWVATPFPENTSKSDVKWQYPMADATTQSYNEVQRYKDWVAPSPEGIPKSLTVSRYEQKHLKTQRTKPSTNIYQNTMNKLKNLKIVKLKDNTKPHITTELRKGLTFSHGTR